MDLEQCFKQPEDQRKECVDSTLHQMNISAEMQAIQAKKGFVWQKYHLFYDPPPFQFNYFYVDGRLHFDYGFYSNTVLVKLPQELVERVPKIPSYVSSIEQLCTVAALSLMLVASAFIATYKRRQSQTGAKYPATPRSTDS